MSTVYNGVFTGGNAKIGQDTLIFNITPATDCESHKRGLCQIPTNCYAIRPERRWKQTLPFRRKQNQYWDNTTPKDFVEAIKDIMVRRRVNKVKYLRFSEAGDFRHQDDVDKMMEITELLPIIVYGYTARKDLDFSGRPKNMVVNGSGFMVDNSFTSIPKKEINEYKIVCSGNCRYCDQCKIPDRKDIKVAIH